MNNASTAHAYEKHKNEYGVKLSYLVSDEDKRHEQSIDAFKYNSYKLKCYRNSAFRLREGRGKGNEALVRWTALEKHQQHALIGKWGHPDMHLVKGMWRDNYVRDSKAAEFYASYRLADGRGLTDAQQEEYTTNASVLNTLEVVLMKRREIRKKKGSSTAPVWDIVTGDVREFGKESGHTIKVANLRRVLRDYKASGYKSLISGKLGKRNAAKVSNKEQRVVLEELIGKHQNLDNAQVAEWYNGLAAASKWKQITPTTVANHRERMGLTTYAARRGESNFRNKISMQHKRTRPGAAMTYWTLDGWDVELMYQKKEDGENTTYHNRPTVVIVLDPCTDYPVGYAIGTHEDSNLIKEACKSAVDHTKLLFGKRYYPLQLQSDHYGKGSLTPFYEAMTRLYTPAKVKNAKSKVIEPYFKHLNKRIQRALMPNWSGFGVTSEKEAQPNSDYLAKIRKNFPDFMGVVQQVEWLIAAERAEKVEAYMAMWDKLPEADRIEVGMEKYLDMFGITTGYTNKLEPAGIMPTINGEKITYDCFDIKFRELAYMDWVIKHDPADLNQALAVNAERKNGQVTEIGTYKLLLEKKHEQPMALYDRKDGDAEQLARINNYNKQLEGHILAHKQENREVLEDLFCSNPALETYQKHLLPDSKGQHKDRRNEARIGKAKKETILIQPVKLDEEYEVIFDAQAYVRAQY